MVKVSSWGKGVEGLFGEYVGIFRVLLRERHFVFVSGDGEFGREGGLADVFVVESHGLLFPIYLRVMLCQPGHSQNYLGSSQSDDHQSQVVFKVGGLTVYGGGSGDSSLFIGSAVDVKGLQGWDSSRG